MTDVAGILFRRRAPELEVGLLAFTFHVTVALVVA